MEAMDDKRARQAVGEVATRCKAILASDLVSADVRRALLLERVFSPTTIRNGTADWLLALHRAVYEHPIT